MAYAEEAGTGGARRGNPGMRFLVWPTSAEVADHARSLAADINAKIPALVAGVAPRAAGDPMDFLRGHPDCQLIQVALSGNPSHPKSALTLFVSTLDESSPTEHTLRVGTPGRWQMLARIQAKFAPAAPGQELQALINPVQVIIVSANPDSDECLRLQRDSLSQCGLSAASVSSLAQGQSLVSSRLVLILYLSSCAALGSAILEIQVSASVKKAQLMTSALGPSIPSFSSLFSALAELQIAHEKPKYSYSLSEVSESARRFEPGTFAKCLGDLETSILSKPFPSCVLFTAPTGSGKSTILGELVRRGHMGVALDTKSAPLAEYIVGAAHFFNSADSECRSSKTAILSLAHQLRSVLPGLDLPSEAQISAAPSTGPAVLLETFVLKPCRDLKRRDVTHPIVVVLDSLDECVEGDELAMAVRETWNSGRPPWLVLVASMERAMLQMQDEFQPIVIKLDADSRLKSIEWYLERRGLPCSEEILQLSEGSFLWVALNEDKLVSNATASKGLKRTYQDMFTSLQRDLGGREAYERALGLLLLAPREVILQSLWRKALTASGLDAKAVESHVLSVLGGVVRVDDKGRFLAKHPSVIAWLDGSDAFSARGMGKEMLAVSSSPELHACLARVCEEICQQISLAPLALASDLSPEQQWAIRHCNFHLVQAAETERARVWFLQAGLLYRMVSVAVEEATLASSNRVINDMTSLQLLSGGDDLDPIITMLQLSKDALIYDPRLLLGQILARFPAPKLVAQSAQPAMASQRKPSVMQQMARGLSRRLSSKRSVLRMAALEETEPWASEASVAQDFESTSPSSAPHRPFSLLDRFSRIPSTSRMIRSATLTSFEDAGQELRKSADKLLAAASLGSGMRIARPLPMMSGLESAMGMCRRRLKSAGPVALSTDGKFCVAGSVFDDSALVLDAQTGEQIWILRGHTGRVTSISISGRLVLTGSMDRSARLFDLNSGRQIKVFKWHRAPVSSVALSHNGLRALTGSTDYTACVWNITLGRLACELGQSDVKESKFSVALGRKIEVRAGHHSPILSVALAHDGSLALTGAADCVGRLWDATNGKLLHSLKDKERRSPVTSVGFVWTTEKKMALTVFNESVAVWSLDQGEFLYSLAGHGGGVVSLACNGIWVITGSRDSHVRLWELETGKPLLTLVGHTAMVTHVGMADKGSVAMSRSDDGTTRVWEMGGHVGSASTATTVELTCSLLSPDGSQLALGDVAGVVHVYVLGEPASDAFKLSEHRSAVLGLFWSSDSKLLLSCARDKTARVWDLTTRSIKWVLRGHFEAVTCCAITLDQGRIVTGSLDETVKTWHNSTGQSVHSMNKHPGPVLCLAIHNRLVLIGAMGKSQALKAWNVDSGAVAVQMDDACDVLSASWANDGKRVVSGHLDGTTRVWDASSASLVFSVAAHSSTDAVDVVQVRLGKKLGYSVTRGGTAKAWDLNSGALAMQPSSEWDEDAPVAQNGKEVGTVDDKRVGLYLDPGSSWVDCGFVPSSATKRAVFRNGVSFGVWEDI